jgi:opacity protein-like surface antigen
MGGAFVAVANDASALYWNPGGVATIKNNQAIFNHSQWIAGIRFDFAGAVLNLGEAGRLGASAAVLSMGEMERTTELQPEGTGETFSAGSYAIGVTYAKMLTDRFSIGMTGKYINEHIMNSHATGVAIDIGTLYRTQWRDLMIGMSISNFGTKMRMSGQDLLVQHDIDPTRWGNNPNLNADLQTDAYDLPLMFRVGIALDVLRNVANQSLILSMDALHPSDNVESMNVGAEYVFHNLVALRAGYKELFSRDSEQGLTLGAGLQRRLVGNLNLQVNYAYQSFGRLENVNKFTILLAF